MEIKLDHVLLILNEKKPSNIKYTTPQPNRSKVFELQQSNQGYGET